MKTNHNHITKIDLKPSYYDSYSLPEITILVLPDRQLPSGGSCWLVGCNSCWCHCYLIAYYQLVAHDTTTLHLVLKVVFTLRKEFSKMQQHLRTVYVFSQILLKWNMKKNIPFGCHQQNCSHCLGRSNHRLRFVAEQFAVGKFEHG